MKKKSQSDEESSEVTNSGLLIEGELTIYTASELKGRLLEALESQESLLIDLSQVSEIDTAGLQLLLMVRREAGERGVSVVFAGHSHAVTECLELCNLSTVLGEQPLNFPAH